MKTSPKTDEETLAFFKILHLLLNSHPDKTLVNVLHGLRNAPGVKDAYFESAWAMMPKPKAKE